MVAKVYCFDLDGTLCRTDGLNYEMAKPIDSHIKKVNKLYELGNTIKIFTARGTETGIDWTNVTHNQLLAWGINYHELLFGKPAADLYIDDKGQGLDFFNE